MSQIVVRMREDLDDYVRRKEKMGLDARNEIDRPTARLLDLEKAYPRVSKPALWMSLERYGLGGGRMLELVMN